MSKMDDKQNVAEQYGNDKNLSARIRLHAKHSTSKIAVSDWLFSQYAIEKPCRILELGCGNAGQWDQNISKLPDGSFIILSDISAGMADIVWEKFRNNKNVLAEKIDIEDIPFASGSFDVVIANHMLYHVPDISKALGEVKRVLAPGGTYFASTNGTGGMRPYLHEKLKEFNPKIDAFKTEQSFTMQNGKKILDMFYDDVKLMEYEDSLRITETQDLVDWIKSTISIANFEEKDLDGLFGFFERIRLKEGTINIPKEMGLFISRNHV